MFDPLPPSEYCSMLFEAKNIFLNMFIYTENYIESNKTLETSIDSSKHTKNIKIHVHVLKFLNVRKYISKNIRRSNKSAFYEELYGNLIVKGHTF